MNRAVFILNNKGGNMQSKDIKAITAQLEQGIQEMFTSEKFKNYLSTMAKFHSYSFNNTILIAMQMPEATYVAGFQSWKKNFERYVKKGETGIKILAPTPYKRKVLIEKLDDHGKAVLDKNGKPVMEEVEKKIPAFKVVSVFDVSQTDGKELPNLVNELNGTVEKFDDFMQALEMVSPVPIEYADIEGNAKGFFSASSHLIALQTGMSEMQTMKTGIHEVAHSILHSSENKAASDKDRKTKEVEAESVAYTVCQYFGIDTSEYSFGYIASWSSGKEMKELKASLETIRATASTMIRAIEDAMTEIVMERKGNRNQEQDQGIATITCEWSEHNAFLAGKTYSVLEFDELFKKCDKEWCVKRAAEEKIFGGREAAIESGKARYQGYAKVKYTIHMPDGHIPSSITERQDIGDGYGGVIDYFKTLPEFKFGNVVKILEKTKELDQIRINIQENKQKASVLKKLHENHSKLEQQSEKDVPEKGEVEKC